MLIQLYGHFWRRTLDVPNICPLYLGILEEKILHLKIWCRPQHWINTSDTGSTSGWWRLHRLSCVRVQIWLVSVLGLISFPSQVNGFLADLWAVTQKLIFLYWGYVSGGPSPVNHIDLLLNAAFAFISHIAVFFQILQISCFPVVWVFSAMVSHITLF